MFHGISKNDEPCNLFNKVAVHLSSLAGPTSQFLNGTHKSSGPVLPSMYSCSWIRAAQFFRSGRQKRGNLESCGGKNVRVRLQPFHLSWPELTSSFRPTRLGKWKATLDLIAFLLWLMSTPSFKICLTNHKPFLSRVTF